MATSENAFRSTSRNLDFDSNLTEESDREWGKQFSSKISTDEGRRISIKPVPLNAISSIRDNRDPDSNRTEESDPQA
jgi:hypothetical protein